MGLSKAAANFDGSGARFASYAQGYIREGLYWAMTKLRSGAFVPYKMEMTAIRAKKIRQRVSASST